MAAVYLGDILAPKRNNFSLIRLLAALSVLISHALLLRSGNTASEYLAGMTFYNLSQHAVNVFFVLSGIMVSASLARSSSLVDFAVARLLRIFPALIACTLVLSLVIGPLVTVLPVECYGTSKTFLGFILRTASMSTGAAPLPGVFVNNPHPVVVGAPIWTLKYEIACYVMLAILALVRGLNSTGRFTTFIITSWIASILILVNDFGSAATPIDHLARFWLCFSFGIALYRLRAYVPLSIGVVGAFGIAWWAVHGSAFEPVISLFATGYWAVWFAALPASRIRQFTNDVDLSYGVYIFGWPITQTIVWAAPDIGAGWLQLLAAMITIVVAALSWFAVEKPALASRGVMTALASRWLQAVTRPNWSRERRKAARQEG